MLNKVAENWCSFSGCSAFFYFKNLFLFCTWKSTNEPKQSSFIPTELEVLELIIWECFYTLLCLALLAHSKTCLSSSFSPIFFVRVLFAILSLCFSLFHYLSSSLSCLFEFFLLFMFHNLVNIYHSSKKTISAYVRPPFPFLF